MSFFVWAKTAQKKKQTTATTAKISAKAPQALDMITLKCTFDNCSSLDSIKLYQSSGYFKEPIMTAYPDKEGQFTFTLPKSKSPQCYFIGLNVDVDKLKPVILGTEKEVTLTGPCYNMELTNVKDSKLNEGFSDAFRKMGLLKIEMNKAAENMQLNYADAKLRVDFENQIKGIDQKKSSLLDSVKKANPFVGKF